MCRFYGFDLDKVMAMTLRTFAGMLNEIATILKMENGSDDDKATSLSGGKAFNLAKRIFPKRR